MNATGKSITRALSLENLIELAFLISLISLLSIPLVLAGEAQSSLSATEPKQPVVSATATPEPQKTMAQALDAYTTSNLVDFLMEEPPLTQSTSPDTASPGLARPTPSINTTDTPVTLQVLQGTVIENTDEVAMLVSEQCSQGGNATEGSNSCERVYSNGHHATVLTQNANEGDELKNQTVIEEFDGDNTLVYRKTIRHRVDYNYVKDQKAMEKELFDIIYQPVGKKTTRELMVYEYFLDTGKVKSLSWTQYKQIGSEPKAELVYHALLRYGDDGSPDRGLAERWDQGKKAETFMNWSRRSEGFASLEEESWNQWEGWIRNASLQAYLP